MCLCQWQLVSGLLLIGWKKKGAEFFKPITKHSKTKASVNNTFNAPVKVLS